MREREAARELDMPSLLRDQPAEKMGDRVRAVRVMPRRSQSARRPSRRAGEGAPGRRQVRAALAAVRARERHLPPLRQTGHLGRERSRRTDPRSRHAAPRPRSVQTAGRETRALRLQQPSRRSNTRRVPGGCSGRGRRPWLRRTSRSASASARGEHGCGGGFWAAARHSRCGSHRGSRDRRRRSRTRWTSPRGALPAWEPVDLEAILARELCGAHIGEVDEPCGLPIDHDGPCALTPVGEETR